MTDILGWRAHIGIVMPSTNTVVQPECESLRPAGVTNHIGRVTVQEKAIASDAAYAEHVEAMRGGIGAAIDQVMSCGPDHLIMGVALEAFWGGVAQADRLQAELAGRAGVPVTLGSHAMRDALNAYGARRIAVLTPHQPRGDAMVQRYLEEAGFEITTLLGLKCASPRQIAQVAPDAVREAYAAIDGRDVDALVQVGTNLAGMRVAAELERDLAKPVLSMNAVTYWRALRTLGIDDRIQGCGRILEEH